MFDEVRSVYPSGHRLYISLTFEVMLVNVSCCTFSVVNGAAQPFAAAAAAAETEINSRSNGDAHPYSLEERNQPGINPSTPVNNGHAHYSEYSQSLEPKEREVPRAETIRVENNGHTYSLNPSRVDIPNVKETRQESNGHVQLSSSKEPKKTPTVVIDLSDDDDEEQEIPSRGNQIPKPHPEQMVWHYLDPQGRIQGPFSLMSLKRWNDANYFGPGFRVWSIGQSPQQAVLLSLILQHIFPN